MVDVLWLFAAAEALVAVVMLLGLLILWTTSEDFGGFEGIFISLLVIRLMEEEEVEGLVGFEE